MGPQEKLASMGLVLPDAPSPLGNYVPAVVTGNLVFISGMLPLREGKLVMTGRLGDSVTVEQGAELAQLAALNALSALKAQIGNLNRVTRCVRLCGYIASAEGFTAQPAVLNGASDLMASVFGDAGKHARAALGVNVLPLDSPLEIEFVFEVAAGD